MKGECPIAYFAPYIDDTGLHMPTYAERLEALTEAYYGIFGIDAELSESVPDYQLLSVVARALDDISQLVLEAYNSRNPLYASGQALDLLLPLYGLRRQEGETDAHARGRILPALAGNGNASAESIAAAILQVPDVLQAQVHENDTDQTDGKGIPPHSICCVVDAGKKADVADAIFRKKAPGIGTHGTTAVSVTDGNGVSHTVRFSRPAQSPVNVYIDITAYAGYDPETTDAVGRAAEDYLRSLRIGQSLVVPRLYGACYAAAGGQASAFAISDIRADCPLIPEITRELVPAGWNTRLYTAYPDRVFITVTDA